MIFPTEVGVELANTRGEEIQIEPSKIDNIWEREGISQVTNEGSMSRFEVQSAALRDGGRKVSGDFYCLIIFTVSVKVSVCGGGKRRIRLVGRLSVARRSRSKCQEESGVGIGSGARLE